MTADEPAPRRSLLAGALVAAGLLGLVLAGVQEARRAGGQPSGQPAPDFALAQMDGGTLRLGSLRGKVVLLDFWATWCGPCVEEMPTLVKLAQAYEAKGVRLVAANRDEPSTWKVDVGLFADRSVPALPPYVVYADEATTERYRVEVLPTLFIIGRTGALLGSYTGYADAAELRARMDRALEASP